jgi:hypothetical protein
VNYEHRLRDSVNELYQFQEHQPPTKRSDTILVNSVPEYTLPQGVFTLLTDCYSPTCTSESLCYSVSCPRRFSQHSQNSLFEENVR